MPYPKQPQNAKGVTEGLQGQQGLCTCLVKAGIRIEGESIPSVSFEQYNSEKFEMTA